MKEEKEWWMVQHLFPAVTNFNGHTWYFIDGKPTAMKV